jgi:hypothetical protein
MPAVIILAVILLLTGLIETIPNWLADFLGLSIMLGTIGWLIWAMFSIAFKK